MANPHPPPFSTGIDATDVTRFFENVLKPAAKNLAVELAKTAIDVLGEGVKVFTPDHIDRIVDAAVVEVKEKLKEAAK